MSKTVENGGAVCGIELVDLFSKRARQDEDFGVGDTTYLGFDLGKRASGQPPAEHAAPGCELVLSDIRDTSQTAYLRANYIASFHAPIPELDGIRNCQLKCSVSGAA
jgi:hypothetical protein